MTDPQVPFDPPASATALTPVPPGGPGAPAVVAFYLPQYHRIPENDAWWGEGFTDWRNVTAAKPLYQGHAVPNLPGEVGAYDLLSRYVRSAQAELAREHGVYGFCHYFYWFGGRRLLERPLELMLSDGQPDLPFCLCWANEPWTRRWDGREQDVLMPQHHDRVRDLAILDDLMPYFEDSRYIRIDGRPLLLVYRQGLMPDAPGFAAGLRADAVRRGLPDLFLCNVLSVGDTDRCAPGFDGAVEFPPQGTLGHEIRPRSLGADRAFRGHIYDYESTVQTAVARPSPSFPCFPGVMPRWDNTARKGLRAHIFHGSTPVLFERWLRRASLDTRRRNPGAPLLFVNSWNEWAEGAHLEPDERVGRAYLASIRNCVCRGQARDADGAGAVPSTQDNAPPDSVWPPMVHVAQTPAISAIPGMPILASGLVVGRGIGWVDEVDGTSPTDAVVPTNASQPLRLLGWFYADARRGACKGCRDYLILESGGSIFHVPITRSQRRPDVMRGMLATSRPSRRLLRASDRMRPAVGSAFLRALTRDRSLLGFDLLLSLSGLPAGRYSVAMLEVRQVSATLVPTPFSLELGHHRIPPTRAPRGRS